MDGGVPLLQGRYSVSTLRFNNTRMAALRVVFWHNVIVIFSKWPNARFRLVINPEAKVVSEPKKKRKKREPCLVQPLTGRGKPFLYYKPQFGSRARVWGKPYNRCLPPSHTHADTLLALVKSSFNYSYWFPSSPEQLLTLSKEEAACYWGILSWIWSSPSNYLSFEVREWLVFIDSVNTRSCFPCTNHCVHISSVRIAALYYTWESLLAPSYLLYSECFGCTAYTLS